MSATFAASADALARGRRQQRYWLGGLALVSAFVLTGVAVSQDPTGELTVAVVAISALIPILVWRVPLAGLVVMLLGSTVVEQYRFVGDGTDQIPFFGSLNSLGLSGLYVTPAEIFLAIFLLTWLLKAGVERRLALPSSPLAVGLAVFMTLVAVAEARGLGRGGQVSVALNELRPWLYLALLYVLASQIVNRRAAVNVLLWTFVIGTGLKGVQGTYEFLRLRNLQPRPDAILGHEEAFFFGLFILLVAGLWLYGDRSRLRAWATALLPTVIIADLGNSRRVSWLILVAGLAVLTVLAWSRLPARRYVVGRLALVMLAASLVYFPTFWNSQGALGQPARALRSLTAPDPRDLSSNLYRQEEDANLVANIQRSVVLGQGFGVPIDYTIPIIDLSGFSSMIRYVPHNGILYLWMRLGMFGALAFWVMIGLAFLAGCQVARNADRRVALFGALAVCGLVAYLIQGYVDLGLFWYRIAVFVGCLLGAVEGLGQLKPEVAASRTSVAFRRE